MQKLYNFLAFKLLTYSFPADGHEDESSKISQQVYVNACKQLHVAPGKKILRSLSSTEMSAKERIVNIKEVETIAYALTVCNRRSRTYLVKREL